MIGACIMRDGDEKCVHNFCWKSRKGRDHSRHVGVNGRIMLKLMLDNIWRVWIEVIWLRIWTDGSLANTVMNLRVA
jgi:hypothetical protein